MRISHDRSGPEPDRMTHIRRGQQQRDAKPTGLDGATTWPRNPCDGWGRSCQ